MLRNRLKIIENDYSADKIIVLRKFASKLVQQRLEQIRTE
jgi:hypothetical protein